MGTRKKRQRQEELWYGGELPTAPGHPFYKRLNEVLDQAGFDLFGVIPAAPAVHLEQAVLVHAALHRRRLTPASVKVLWAASTGLSLFVSLAFAHTRGFTVFSLGPKTGRVGLQPATAFLSVLQSATGAGSRLGSRCAAGLA